MQMSLFNNIDESKTLVDLFQAYYDARKNKRNTLNALAYEKYFESNLFELYEEIQNRNYKPKPSICFVVNKPVKREIFAAYFRDRIIHHFIYNYISPIFEKEFINDCYSCRTGKGTHYGINRIDHFIRSCSMNYSEDAYILKLDIKGYFMSINKSILLEKVMNVYCKNKFQSNFDYELVEYLIKQTIHNDPRKNCIIKGSKSNWIDLPRNKSLFFTKENCGLPIGNLTSQLFGNIYLNDFDHFFKKNLKIKYFGRYVDDFILIDKNKDYIVSLIPVIRDYLKDELSLELHPDKVYFQHFSQGVKYLGAIIKPYRKYISTRTKGNFFESINKQSSIARDHKPDNMEKDGFISSMNSYLGIMKHFKTYKLRKFLIYKYISGWWWNYIYIKNKFGKFLIKK